jgi:hypothetical protein
MYAAISHAHIALTTALDVLLPRPANVRFAGPIECIGYRFEGHVLLRPHLNDSQMLRMVDDSSPTRSLWDKASFY